MTVHKCIRYVCNNQYSIIYQPEVQVQDHINIEFTFIADIGNVIDAIYFPISYWKNDKQSVVGIYAGGVAADSSRAVTVGPVINRLCIFKS